MSCCCIIPPSRVGGGYLASAWSRNWRLHTPPRARSADDWTAGVKSKIPGCLHHPRLDHGMMQPSHNEHWTIVQSNELTTKRRDQWLLSSGRKVCPHNFPVGNGKCCWSNSMSTFLWSTSNRNDMVKQYVHQSLSKHFDQPLTWTNSTSTNHWPNTLTNHPINLQYDLRPLDEQFDPHIPVCTVWPKCTGATPHSKMVYTHPI